MAETKYDESFPEQAMGFAADGLTDGQIASRMDISRSSLYNYKQQHPEFAEAIEAGREAVDDRVENRLLELALGDYSITIHVTDHEGRTRTTVKSAVPNLKAIQYWLERSDRRKGIKPAPLCGSRDCGIDKREKLEEKAEQPKTEPELDPSEIAGLQALAEYMSMCPADAGDGFSKKETEEFEDMMLVTFTEMERRKYNTKAATEGLPLIPDTAAAPRTVKGKYAPDMIRAWKDRAEFFELDL
ncbi:MAG: hypothetical protein WC721_19870 [Victivallaceae bacterium]|jgi:hypothetical protein